MDHRLRHGARARRHRGAAARRSACQGRRAAAQHYITNIIITLEADTARAVSDYLVVRESERGLLPVMGGTYRDVFVKLDAGWFFRRKELVHDIVGDMALKNSR